MQQGIKKELFIFDKIFKFRCLSGVEDKIVGQMPNCQKRSYVTENLALDALIEARIRFLQNSSVTVYQCEDCGQWHLTSRGNIHPRLAKELTSGNVEKSRLAYQWEKKLGY